MAKATRLSLPIVVTALVFALAACSKLRSRNELKWHLVLEVTPTNSLSLEEKVTQTAKVIERRLDLIGIRNFEVRVQEPATKGRIEVSLPSLPDPERIKRFLVQRGSLELVHVISPPSPAPSQTYTTEAEAIASLGGTIPTNRRVLKYREHIDSNADANQSLPQEKPARWLVVEVPEIINGTELRNATAVPAQAGASNEFEISFSLNKNGADKFGTWTGAHINEYMGIVLNDEVHSIAFIKSQIFDQGQIEGRYTKQSAEDLVHVLNSGSLPARVELVEERTN